MSLPIKFLLLAAVAAVLVVSLNGVSLEASRLGRAATEIASQEVAEHEMEKKAAFAPDLVLKQEPRPIEQILADLQTWTAVMKARDSSQSRESLEKRFEELSNMLGDLLKGLLGMFTGAHEASRLGRAVTESASQEVAEHGEMEEKAAFAPDLVRKQDPRHEQILESLQTLITIMNSINPNLERGGDDLGLVGSLLAIVVSLLKLLIGDPS